MMTFIDYICSFGGLLGLCFGISAYDISIKLLNFFITLISKCMKLDKFPYKVFMNAVLSISLIYFMTIEVSKSLI